MLLNGTPHFGSLAVYQAPFVIASIPSAIGKVPSHKAQIYHCSLILHISLRIQHGAVAEEEPLLWRTLSHKTIDPETTRHPPMGHKSLSNGRNYRNYDGRKAEVEKT